MKRTFKEYRETPGLRRHLTVVHAQGSIWARIDEHAETAWSWCPAPGKLVRVGVVALKGIASFKEFRVETAHD